ncbi:MAG: type I DNA topoisomerase [Proteobacteria bacterium]|nr:type I DNA topoisomerase [Pseudomonadota bacterium]
MKVVVVESPAKAKSIQSYLGKDYKVLASFGHIRDLPSKDGSVKPDEDFEMTWDVSSRSHKTISEIVSALKKADTLYLATDPDREGEAISWHLEEVLRHKKALPATTKRIVFHEITKKAILEAIQHPRDLDKNLIDSYLARRALDYLMGFTLSPVLWRKLPGSRSAGRVQSVALRLVTERESEIEAFTPQEYWSIEALFQTVKNVSFQARLTHLKGKKLQKLTLSKESEAQEAVDLIKKAESYAVLAIEKKKTSKHPAPPFTTSTLQQDAARKLGFSASHTMRIAQSLYEGIDLKGETVGLITYMRTDSVQLSKDAIAEARAHIDRSFGKSYLPEHSRVYTTKVRNAQEAHEAIRPTDLSKDPLLLKTFLNKDELGLYTLIWKRTLASQMVSASYDQMSIDIAPPSKEVILRATGSTLVFDGFLKVYEESTDNDDASSSEEKTEGLLPSLQEKDPLSLKTVTPSQHFTQPPPRYTEASLIKKLEDLGIGRPSTYASILQVIRERNYVRLEKKQFIPEERGRIVTAFLENYFSKYVEYTFTADLEDNLDKISEGHLFWKNLLKGFWTSLKEATEETKELRVADVLTLLNEKLKSHLFPASGNHEGEPQQCPLCAPGKLSLKLGKFGAFIGCSEYPTCRYTRPIGSMDENEEASQAGEKEGTDYPKILGIDPLTQGEISLRKGPYGFYIQLDLPEAAQEKGKKPKRVALPKNASPETFTFESAKSLLSLPRDIGKHPETKEMISAGVGRFGPFLKHQGTFTSLKKEDDVLTIGLNRAVTLLAEAALKPKKERPIRKKKSTST